MGAFQGQSKGNWGLEKNDGEEWAPRTGHGLPAGSIGVVVCGARAFAGTTLRRRRQLPPFPPLSSAPCSKHQQSHRTPKLRTFYWACDQHRAPQRKETRPCLARAGPFASARPSGEVLFARASGILPMPGMGRTCGVAPASGTGRPVHRRPPAPHLRALPRGIPEVQADQGEPWPFRDHERKRRGQPFCRKSLRAGPPIQSSGRLGSPPALPPAKWYPTGSNTNHSGHLKPRGAFGPFLTTKKAIGRSELTRRQRCCVARQSRRGGLVMCARGSLMFTGAP